MTASPDDTVKVPAVTVADAIVVIPADTVTDAPPALSVAILVVPAEANTAEFANESVPAV